MFWMGFNKSPPTYFSLLQFYSTLSIYNFKKNNRAHTVYMSKITLNIALLNLYLWWHYSYGFLVNWTKGRKYLLLLQIISCETWKVLCNFNKITIIFLLPCLMFLTNINICFNTMNKKMWKNVEKCQSFKENFYRNYVS